jgi:DNA-binding MarR family transcriptional regulator
MTKQAMAELVSHLEAHGYVSREPDPSDRRAKLVLPTVRGRAVIALAQGMVPELESRVTQELGEEHMVRLCGDLESIRRVALAYQNASDESQVGPA